MRTESRLQATCAEILAMWARGLHYSADLRIYRNVYGTGSVKMWKTRAQDISGYTDIFLQRRAFDRRSSISASSRQVTWRRFFAHNTIEQTCTPPSCVLWAQAGRPTAGRTPSNELPLNRFGFHGGPRIKQSLSLGPFHGAIAVPYTFISQ